MTRPDSHTRIRAMLEEGLWIEGSLVEVWALGEDRFKITAPGHEQIVTGFDGAERTADALAERLKRRKTESAGARAGRGRLRKRARWCRRLGETDGTPRAERVHVRPPCRMETRRCH